ncbi:hypothetical protein BX616_001916 [Lobosporangium transversale]|nr:hypothetical protein BX616_001916 [Lobosporangium transversale]
MLYSGSQIPIIEVRMIHIYVCYTYLTKEFLSLYLNPELLSDNRIEFIILLDDDGDEDDDDGPKDGIGFLDNDDDGSRDDGAFTDDDGSTGAWGIRDWSCDLANNGVDSCSCKWSIQTTSSIIDSNPG